MSTTSDAGLWGEEEVARYLRRRGYSVLDARWRCRFGEIDLIARDGQGLLCFVEVKLRSNVSHGLPREFVDVRKQRKLRSTAACYLARGNLDEEIRFDVAEVYADPAYTEARITYLENAF